MEGSAMAIVVRLEAKRLELWLEAWNASRKCSSASCLYLWAISHLQVLLEWEGTG
jgi:hypothetical protein